MTRHYFRAELLRSRWTLASWLPAVLAILAAVITVLLSTGVDATRLASSHLYAVAILAPLAALTAVTGESREERLRSGGLIWRNLSKPRTLAARAGVVALYTVLGHALMAAILAESLTDAALFILVNTVAFLSMWALGLAAWHLIGRAAMAVAPVVAIGWSIGGVLAAENPNWLILPWTWLIRPTLPVYGVQANSVEATADSPIWDIDIATPVLLQAALGVALFGVALLPRRSGQRRTAFRRAPRSHTATQQPATATPMQATSGRWARSSSLSRGLAVALPWRTWSALAVLMCVAIVGLRAWKGTGFAAGVTSFLAVPAAATIVAVMSASSQGDAWPALMYRRVRGKLAARLLLIDLTFLVPTLVVGMTLAGAGGDYRWIYQSMVAPFVAALIVTVVGLVAIRSRSAAILVSIVVAAWSILVGGDALNAGPLWWTSPWAWTWTVRDYPERWVTVVLVSTLVVVTIIAFSAVVIAGRAERGVSEKTGWAVLCSVDCGPRPR